MVLQPTTSRPARVARGDEPRLLGPPALERAADERGAVSHSCAAAAAAGRSARRELGPHRRQGRHLPALRPLRRPEPRDGGRPAPLPRDRAGADSRQRLAADRPVPPHQAARRRTTRCCAATGSTPGDPSSSSAGTRRATRPTRGGSSSVSSSGGITPRASACSFSSGPTRATPAGRSASRPQLGRGHRGAGGELLGHRGARDAAPTRGCRRLQRGDDPARRARGRPAGRLRALRRGSAAGGVVGGEERRRRALPGARGLRRVSIAPSASRRSWPASSARSSSRQSSPRRGAGPSSRSSARSTAGRRSGSSTRRRDPRGARGMRLVMTLLARDEADVVDAQVAFHLHAGVDFVVATTTRRATGRRRSSSGTSAPASCGSSASRRRHAPGHVGHADGAARGDRPRRRLGDQLGCGRVLVAARRVARRTCLRRCPPGSASSAAAGATSCRARTTARSSRSA